MKTNFFSIQVYGKGVFGRNRTAKPFIKTICRVVDETCVVISDDVYQAAIKELKEAKVRSGWFEIGAFKGHETNGIEIVSLVASQRQGVSLHHILSN